MCRACHGAVASDVHSICWPDTGPQPSCWALPQRGPAAPLGSAPTPSHAATSPRSVPSHRRPPPHVPCSPLPLLEASPLQGHGTWDSQSCTPCAAAPPSSAAGAQRRPRRPPAPSPRAGADGSGTLGWARASAVFGRTLSSRAAAHAPPRPPHRTQAPPLSRPELQPNHSLILPSGSRPRPYSSRSHLTTPQALGPAPDSLLLWLVRLPCLWL